jgi:hypothetical protein
LHLPQITARFYEDGIVTMLPEIEQTKSKTQASIYINGVILSKMAYNEWVFTQLSSLDCINAMLHVGYCCSLDFNKIIDGRQIGSILTKLRN